MTWRWNFVGMRSRERRLTSTDVRAMAVRLPQVHGGEGKCGLLEYALNTAREKRVSAYVGDGGNRAEDGHGDTSPDADLACLCRAVELVRVEQEPHQETDEPDGEDAAR